MKKKGYLPGYCIYCGGPIQATRVFGRSREFKCMGGQNCGKFTIVFRRRKP